MRPYREYYRTALTLLQLPNVSLTKSEVSPTKVRAVLEVQVGTTVNDCVIGISTGTSTTVDPTTAVPTLCQIELLK